MVGWDTDMYIYQVASWRLYKDIENAYKARRFSDNGLHRVCIFNSLLIIPGIQPIYSLSKMNSIHEKIVNSATMVYIEYVSHKSFHMPIRV